MSTEVLRIAHLDKWYGTQHALRDVNLAVGNQERIVICGPAGCGKSTLMRCIHGMEPFQRGEVEVCGVHLGPQGGDLALARRDVGMVFQHVNLFPHMTVLENCTIAPRSMRRMGAVEAEAAALELLARVGVAEHARKYPCQLSPGQLQRVSIARALCTQPKLMLFDEPTSGLDADMAREVLDTMAALAGDALAMVCVTHELEFAREVAHRIVFMEAGQVLEAAPAAEFFAAPRHERARAFLATCREGPPLHAREPAARSAA